MEIGDYVCPVPLMGNPKQLGVIVAIHPPNWAFPLQVRWLLTGADRPWDDNKLYDWSSDWLRPVGALEALTRLVAKGVLL